MGDSTKPSAPTSEPDSTGPESLRARLYSVLPSGELDFVGDLTGCTRGGAAARLKEPASAAGAKPGDLIVVIFQEDRVLSVASLSFVNRLSEAAADDVGGGKSDSDDMSGLIDSEEEGKEGDLVLKMASVDLADGKGVLYSEDNDSEGGKDKSDCEDMKNLLDSDESNWEEDEDAEEETDEDAEEENDEDAEEETDEDAEEETDEDDESDDDDNEDALENDKLTLKYDCWIQVRVWSTYAVIVLYVGGRWRLTRQHTLHWLQPAEIEAMLERVGIEDDGTLALSSWPKVKLTLAFEGTLGCSDSVERLVNSLTPSMDNFQVNEVIGVTSTSKIYRGAYVDTCLGDLEFALKKLQITEEFDDEEAIDHQEPREVTIFSSLKGSNIVGFFQAWACDGIYKTSLKGSDNEVYDVLEDGPDPRYFIIQMELCHRTLHDVLEAESVREVKAAWATFKEITKAAKYIHQNGVIHRDLKPGNIFLGSPGMNQIKVGDFGHGCWSKNYADGQEGTPSRGTPLYFAPELNETSEHTDKADMYSIGVILVELFHYFKTGQEKVEVLGGLKNGKYPTEWRGDMVLLKKLTSSSPQARPSAKEVLNCISNYQ